MKKISTYQEWSVLLEKFKKGDDGVLVNLLEAQFTLSAGTGDKFLKMIDRTYKTRKQKWHDEVQNTINKTNLKSIAEFDLLIRQWKINLTPLIKFISLKPIPENIKQFYQNDLQKFVSEVRKTLQKSLQNNALDKEQMLFYLRNLEIYDFSVTNAIQPQQNQKPTGRKIIF